MSNAGPNRQPGPPAALRRFAFPLTLGALTMGGVYTYMSTRAPTAPGTPKTSIKTFGTQNIEKAYENSGATGNNTPAYGGSVQGGTSARRDDTGFREGSAVGEQFKGRSSTKFQQEGMGEDQRPVQPNFIGKMWNSWKYGSEKGK